MEKLKKVCATVMLIYIVLAFSFYFIAGESFRSSSSTTDMVSAKAFTGEIYAGQILTQGFKAKTDTIDGISVYGATFERINEDTLTFSITDSTGKLLASKDLEASVLKNNAKWSIDFDAPLENVKGGQLVLSITSKNGRAGNAVTVYYGNSIVASRVSINLNKNNYYPLYVDGKEIDGMLCFSVSGTDFYWVGQNYWIIAVGFGLILAAYCLFTLSQKRKGRNTLVIRAVMALSKYRFLIKQLVSRDFKTKYKRSVMGVLWSFLNPLLTMSVQYVVFSTLFKSTIEYYQVYLLTGIVCISFFMETSSLCLSSITGNAFLIMKVYVPKYVFPFSRTLSSGINFLFSLIPLFAALFLSGLKLRISILLLPFGIACLFFFCIGIGMLLASMMVFFRDTQFLWGVISTLWMYMTPIFYPESIIPESFATIFKLNPLYHIIRFFRIILINGVSPEPKAYIFCTLASIIPFLFGLAVFIKTQDKFILHI